MSVFSGPEIPNSGIICQIDAGNSRCYPGTGSAWTDVSGNGGAGAVNGAMTWSNRSWSNFTGVSGNNLQMTMSSSTASLFSHGTGDFTYSFWLYFTTLSVSYQGIFSMGSGINSLIRAYTTTSIDIIGGVTGSTQQITPTIPTLSLNTWTMISLVRQSGSLTVYVNSTPNTPTAFTPTYSFTSSDVCYIGNPNFTGQQLNGNFSVFNAYNRALSAAEIGQNFEALRGRFNV